MVEELITEKSILKKIVIAILFVFMFNFVFGCLGNNIVFADEEENGGSAETVVIEDDTKLKDGGGKLLLPIHALILWIADSILELLQNSFFSDEPIIHKAKSKEMSQGNAAALFLAVTLVVVAVGITIFTYGAASASVASASTAIVAAKSAGTGVMVAKLAAVSTVAKIVAGGVICTAGVSYAAHTQFSKFIKDIRGEFDLPNILYTPERIFSNTVPLFDINFFNPSEEYKVEKNISYQDSEDTEGYSCEKAEDNYIYYVDNPLLVGLAQKTEGITWEKISYEKDVWDWYGDIGSISDDTELYGLMEKAGIADEFSTLDELKKGGDDWILLSKDTTINELTEVGYVSGDYTDYYRVCVNNQDNILKNLPGGDSESLGFILIFLNRKENTIYRYHVYDTSGNDETIDLYSATFSTNDDGTVTVESVTYESSANVLRDSVGSTYNSLKYLAIVALLIILLYVGIRMVILSTSKDKAKYKQMLIDWLVALILVFVIHYIMAFIIEISNIITQVCVNSNIENIVVPIPEDTQIQNPDTGEWHFAGEAEENLQEYGNNGAKGWGTNFIGMARYYAGLVQQKGFTLKGVSFTVMYVTIVIYLVMFTFQYMRRVLYMAFLTMIAPLVAVTYPIDKINDGRAQGFSMWLKEYIFNALLQPIHFIIYVVVMGSVMKLVINHPVYALVALGFMVPAEKFIRKMFGFEKAGTVSSFGAAAGGAALMSGLQKLRHNANKKKDDDNDAKGEKDKNTGKIREKDSMPGGEENSNSDTPLTDSANEDSSTNTPRTVSQASDSESTGGSINVTDDSATEGEQGETTRTNPAQETENTNESSDTSGEKTKSAGGFKNGLKAMYGYGVRKVINRSKKARPLKTLRRAVTFGAGALGGAIIGTAAGIASGDPSKVLQYGMAGGMATGSLTKNLGETAANGLDIDGNIDAYKRGSMGEAYDEIKRHEYQTDFKNNVSNYKAALSSVGLDGWEEMSKPGGIIDESLDYGITNINDMTKIYKMQKMLHEEKGKSEQEAKDYAFCAYDLTSKFGKYGSDSKVGENIDKLLKNRGITNEEERKQQKAAMLKLIRLYTNNSDEGDEEGRTRPDYRTLNI